jgi:glycosyltransferase involved in cell wall biosynthesis
VEGSSVRRPERPPTALFVGRLVAWKGAWLAIDATARLDGWRLSIVGDGRDAERLRLMREEADVFLFPSLHDEGGWVVGEALAGGLPVACVDRGGPPTIGGHGVPLTSASHTAARLAEAVEAAYHPPGPLAPAPTVERRRAEIMDLLRKHGLLDPAAADDHAETGDDNHDRKVPAEP